MSELEKYNKTIHICSKCGLCQASCPIYKITGNDCTVSRGMFIMLDGVLKNKLKMNNNINKYLDLCLKCNACANNCPSGINIVNVLFAAKSEYFNNHPLEKIVSYIQKNLIYGLFLNILEKFAVKTKSAKFERKVLYFSGCGAKITGNKSVIKIMNNIGIEVLTPNFSCCGIHLLIRGDINGFRQYINNFIKILKQFGQTEIVTNCATCEKILKEYSNWVEQDEDKEFLQKLSVRNVYSYLKEANFTLELQNKHFVTYHKPCNINNMNDIEWILHNTKNLHYVKMENFDECCGFSGITNFKEYNIMKNVFMKKRNNIIKTNTKTVLTSCLACKIALNMYSLNRYKADDLLDFLFKNLKK